ncbi:DUF421 domain-containing protein [Ureibacillus terrenus]|uniref:DUF421 domain-containing protein n=1 Tax=Ureibacillus terrenus TaxID=118246 RepID=UPI0015EE8D2C|nr:DUF421 domain-containing protein [Ureibacillus terrenus]MED3662117.1 DUF421 domain-containing protein [Ureibacillus terrenus]MED3764469.1 DUF421 domain-containing protein [Ureibacillus terrenus]
MENFWEVNFLDIVIRSVITFMVILVLARIIGKKQLSQLTFFHYITGITIGSIAGEMTTQLKTPFFDGIVALLCWTVLTLLMSFISIKSTKIRVIVDDRPTILIQDGVINQHGLKKARLHVDELAMLLREQGVFSFEEVQYAVFETNGELSIMKKSQYSPATKKDVSANVSQPTYFPTEVISDGKIVKKNLDELNLTEEWLLNKLKKKKIKKVEDVFFAQVLEDGSLYVSLFNNKNNKEGLSKN